MIFKDRMKSERPDICETKYLRDKNKFKKKKNDEYPNQIMKL